MARPKSADKRNAILDAAVTTFAARGVWTTPTAAISKAAGVAEGTLFTYFATKEVLVNELYLVLKRDLAQALMSTFPQTADVRTKVRHIWNHYVRWGMAYPEKFKVMAQLSVSNQVTEESRAAGAVLLAELEKLFKDCIKRKVIRNYPVHFIGAMLSGLAETTMGFVAQAGRSRTDYCAAGFDIFWQGITVPGSTSRN
jgi:AcrR family transcriptional regulator